MRSAFPGFSPEALKFFRGLTRNNNRDWFQKRKPVFEESVKQPMRQLVDALNSTLLKLAPEYVTDPDKAIYRIYRDVRFSKDKKPYKEHVAASFHRRGTVGHGEAGYYFAVSHKEVAIGGGVYMPEPAQLHAIRNHVAEHHDEFRRILASRPLRRLVGDLQGDQLTRAPKGFSPDHPAVDLLKFKNYFLYITLPPDLATSSRLYPEILDRFRIMLPFMRFLTAPLPAQRKKIDASDLFL